MLIHNNLTNEDTPYEYTPSESALLQLDMSNPLQAYTIKALRDDNPVISVVQPHQPNSLISFEDCNTADLIGEQYYWKLNFKNTTSANTQELLNFLTTYYDLIAEVDGAHITIGWDTELLVPVRNPYEQVTKFKLAVLPKNSSTSESTCISSFEHDKLSTPVIPSNLTPSTQDNTTKSESKPANVPERIYDSNLVPDIEKTENDSTLQFVTND